MVIFIRVYLLVFTLQEKNFKNYRFSEEAGSSSSSSLPVHFNLTCQGERSAKANPSATTCPTQMRPLAMTFTPSWRATTWPSRRFVRAGQLKRPGVGRAGAQLGLSWPQTLQHHPISHHLPHPIGIGRLAVGANQCAALA